MKSRHYILVLYLQSISLVILESRSLGVNFMLKNVRCALFLNILLSCLLLAGCGDGKQKPTPDSDSVEAEQSAQDQDQSTHQKKSKKKKDKGAQSKEKKVKPVDESQTAANPATTKPATTKPTTSLPATAKPATTKPTTPIPGTANTPAANLATTKPTAAKPPAAEMPLDKKLADTLPLDPKPVENPQTPSDPSSQTILEEQDEATTPESVLERFKDYDQSIYNDLVEKNDPLAMEHSTKEYQALLGKAEVELDGEFIPEITWSNNYPYWVSDINHVSKTGKRYGLCRFGHFKDFLTATDLTSKYLDLLKKSKDKYNGTLYPKIAATTISGNDGKFHTSIVTYEEEENTPPVQEKHFWEKSLKELSLDTFLGGLNLYNSLVNKILPVLLLSQDPDERLISELDPTTDLNEAIKNAEVFLKLKE